MNYTGNKCDLETLREVEFEEAEALCETVPEIMTVMEVSAKDNTNVDDTFFHLAAELKVWICMVSLSEKVCILESI